MRNAIIFLAFLFPLLWSDGLFAWPENVRFGYTNCSSCHVSPSGGGTLTEYGKGISAESSLIDNESFGPSNYSAFPSSKYFLLGGNIRNLYIKQFFEDSEREHKFLMQAEIEGVLIYKQITLVGSYGVTGHEYGTEPKPESRKYYAQYSDGEKRFRVGNFIPIFGLGIDDHTEQIAIYGKGDRENKIEVGFESELFAVSAAASETTTNIDIRLFFGRDTLCGASLREVEDLEKEDLAFYAISGLGKGYIMAEVLQQNYMKEHYYFRTGYEIYRGIIPYFKWTMSEFEQYSYGAQLLPIAHMEILFESTLAKEYIDYLLITNYYL
jgi:hypothetical protein